MSKKNSTIQENESVLDKFILPVQKERRGYAAHFSKVYAPLILDWLSVKAKISPDKGIPLCVLVAEHAPFMLSAFPAAQIKPHREQVEATVRLCLLTEKEMKDSEDWDKRWRYNMLRREADGIGKGMWLYRSGYDEISFTFYGGHDQGSTDDHMILRDGEEMDEIDEEMEGNFSLQDFVEDILPEGFGDGEPAYEDGECSIDLKTMKFSVECSMSVTRHEHIEREGSIFGGIDLDYHED